MNRLLLAVLGLAVVILAVGGEEAGSEVAEGSVRAVRETGDQKKPQAAGKKKAQQGKGKKKAAVSQADNKKKGKKANKGGKKQKGKKQTGKKQKGKKQTGKKQKGGKKAGQGKKEKKAKGKKKAKKAGGNKGKKSAGRQATTCAADAACLLAAGKYYQQVMVKGVNYNAQLKRISTFSKQVTSKGGKKDDFAPTLNHMKDVGGGNASALACGGSTSGTGASSLQTVVANLSSCSSMIDTACNSGAPVINATQTTDCGNAIGNLTAGVLACSALNGTAACACWKDTKLANLSATVAACDLSALNRNATSLKSGCLGAYTKCKGVSNTAPNLISSCNSNAGDLTSKLKTATTNANALADLQTALNGLVASAGGSKGRRQATTLSCSAFGSQAQEVSKKAQNAPGSSDIGDTAKALVARKPSSCTSADLSVLQAALNFVVQAVAFVTSLITSIQANLQSLTGTTASQAAIAAATTAGGVATSTASAVTTKAPAGLRRMGIRQIFQRSQVLA